MIKEAHEYNETVKPNEFEVSRLRKTLPEYFDKNGNFMLDRLKESLQKYDVSLEKEGYELKFLGKSFAKYLTSTKTETVIVPDQEHNSLPENKGSENLYIVGDNLDALKHLLGSYSGEVKCIYIDPPYNTGSDGFVYNDNFGFTPSHLVDKVGLDETEAERVLDLSGRSSHSAWMTFMYPRLELAKELLDEDGVIFISIDENEQANLKLLCDEIFGEMNGVGTLVWRSTPGSNTGDDMKIVTEYVLAYAREKTHAIFKGVAANADEYKLTDAHIAERGPYKENKLDRRMTGSHYSEALNYPITMPDGSELWPGDSHERQEHWNWRWSREKVAWGFDNNFLVPKKRDKGWSVYFKQYLLVDNTNTPIERAKPPQNLFDIEGINVSELSGVSSARGTTDAMKLMGGKFFDYPKPVKLIEYLVSLLDPNDIVVDFFSGSATTAEAVMNLNAKDGENRRYVMVQLPETVSTTSSSGASRSAATAGYQSLDEVGRERITRAADKIKEDQDIEMDYGFRLFRLKTPTVKTLDDLIAFDPDRDEGLFSGDYVEKFSFGQTSGHDTILATWLVEDNYGFAPTIDKVRLNDYTLDLCENSAYIIPPGLGSADVIELVRKIETNELDISRIVVFGYSVEFSVMHELKKNLSVLKSGRTVNVIERL